MEGMSSRTRAIVLIVSTPLVALVVIGGLVGAARVPQDGVRPLKVFEDVITLVVRAYVEEVEVDRVMDGAMRGLADGLDSSSGYLTPAEVRVVEAGAPLPVGEIGITVERRFYLRVLGVRDGSPAERAGIKSGDFIRAIDGQPTRDMSAHAGTRLLRGAPGSKVALLVIRGNAADPHEIIVAREAIDGARVTSRRLAGGERYIRVASFGPGAADAIRANLGALSTDAVPDATARLSGAIIDLRSTGDGTADEAIRAARLFVKEGPIATRAGRTPADAEKTVAQPGDGALTMPLVVLVSNGTSHAAEIFAAALDGANRATLVGEPTAGVAGVQRLAKLPEGHGLWMTYARYLQADGTPIHGRGLRPDVLVEIPVPAFGEVPPAEDGPLNRAVEALRNPSATAPATHP